MHELTHIDREIEKLRGDNISPISITCLTLLSWHAFQMIQYQSAQKGKVNSHWSLEFMWVVLFMGGMGIDMFIQMTCTMFQDIQEKRS